MMFSPVEFDSAVLLLYTSRKWHGSDVRPIISRCKRLQKHIAPVRSYRGAADAHWVATELWAESRAMTGRAAKYLIGG